MVEMGFCFLVQRMGAVCGHIFFAGKLRIQRIVSTGKAAADFHLQKAGDLTHQGLQLGGDELYGIILVNALFQGIQYNVFDHSDSPQIS